MVPFTLLDLGGAVALLLWGTHMVQTGVQRAFGPRLRAWLGAALRSRSRAFLAGLGVTALVQSSTATGLMVAGFAAGGLVELVPALAVMLGANVGTTLIVQALSFNVTALSPALILLGLALFRRAGPVPHDLGRVFIGLGLMQLALHQLLDVVAPFEDAPGLATVLGLAGRSWTLDLIVGAGLTWAAHSSVAVVLFAVSLASHGTLSPDAAFALVLGANVGSAVNPLLEGGGADPVARRLPLGNLSVRTLGALAAMVALAPLGRWMVQLEPDPGRAVAGFHTLFNLVLAGLAFPFLGPLAGALRRLLPERADPADPARPLYLDPAARETPIVALGGAAREALRLVDGLATMLQGTRETLQTGSRQRLAETRRLDDVLDALNDAIRTYLISLDPEALSADDHQRLGEILAFASNLEQAGDVVDRYLLPHAAKRWKRGLAPRGEEERALARLMDRLEANLQAAAALFMTRDARAARLLAAEKQFFREAEAAAADAHVRGLRSGRLDRAETGALHLDLLRDLKLINAHLVAAAAYPVLDGAGELLPSRLAANLP